MDHSVPGSLISALLEDLLERVTRLERLHVRVPNGAPTTHGEAKRMDSKQLQETIEQLKASGMGNSKIAERIGLTPQAVYVRLKKAK